MASCSSGADNNCGTACPPATFSTTATTTETDANTTGVVGDEDDEQDESGSSTGRQPDVPVDCPWWDPAWSQRIPLTLTGAAAGINLTNVPVLVALTPDRFSYAMAGEAGQDLRFVAEDDATVLPHEIELWDPAGTSLVWVSVPSVTGPANAVWLYYGNPVALDIQNAAELWGADFQLVAHLDENSVDSTGLTALTSIGPTVTDGFVGSAQSFPGDDNYLDAASPAHLDDVFSGGATLSVWIRPTDFGGSDWGRIFDKSDGADAARGYFLATSDHFGGSTLEFRRHFMENGRGRWQSPPDSITLGQWQWIVFAWDETAVGSAPQIFIDGAQVVVEEQDSPGSTPHSDAESPLWIGERADRPGRAFVGSMDELRIAKTIRSADWVTLQYASMTDTLLTHGAAQIVPPECG